MMQLICIECRLHRRIPGVCILRCSGSAVDVNLVFINIEVSFLDCFNAKNGLTSLNFSLVSGSLMEFNRFVMVSIM